MAKLSISSLTTENGNLVIALTGEIDVSSADAFYNQIAELYQANPSPIVFDCKELTFIDSTALGAFVKVNRMTSAYGHTVTIQGAKNNVKKLFVICALDKVFAFEG